jgi:hypothetical protein
MHAVTRLLTTATVTVAMAILVVPAQAAPAAVLSAPVWAVGECYQLTSAQIKMDALPEGLTAVPCTGSHNVEVTFSGPVSARTAAAQRAAARANCSLTNSYAAIGLPVKKAIWRNSGAWPVLTGHRWATADRGGLVCAVGITWYAKPGKGTAKTLNAPLSALVSTDPNTASNTASACFTALGSADRKSISCDPANWPRVGTPWMTDGIVNAQAKFGSTWPGEARMRAYAISKCTTPLTPWSGTYPNASQWANGLDIILCYRQAGL